MIVLVGYSYVYGSGLPAAAPSSMLIPEGRKHNPTMPEGRLKGGMARPIGSNVRLEVNTSSKDHVRTQ